MINDNWTFINLYLLSQMYLPLPFRTSVLVIVIYRIHFLILYLIREFNLITIFVALNFYLNKFIITLELKNPSLSPFTI